MEVGVGSQSDSGDPTLWCASAWNENSRRPEHRQWSTQPPGPEPPMLGSKNDRTGEHAQDRVALNPKP